MASNSRTLADENGEYSDWIELANIGTNTVNLDGWYLTDDASDLTKWQLPATNLNAGGFLIVFASNKDRRIPGTNLHTNFRLSTGGEYLALVKPDGTNIATEFAPTFPPQAPDVSYGFGVLTTNQTLITTNSPVLVSVPANGDDDLTWTTPGYDDSAWMQGTNGIGYGSTNVAQADYSASVLPMAPVGYWRFSEPSGTTAVNLGSGSGLNATYTSATLGTAGPRPPQFNGFEPDNNAPTFNGTSGFAAVNNTLLSGRAAFTIGGWVKAATTPVSRIGLFGQNDCVEFGFINSTTLECWTPSGGSLDAPYTIPLNTWHHIAAVGNGVNLRIFVDGELIGTGGGPTAGYGSSSFNFNIGGGGIYDGTGNFFNGQIDEVVVFHRALSTNDIRSLYSGAITPAGVSVLPFVNTDIGAAMSNVNATAYIRIPFTVVDPANVALLTLRMRYDDGFVAFLNGDEVVRVNAPAVLAYNSRATNSHTAISVNEYRIGPGLLQAGTNVLAIQGLNVAATNEDFLIQAELIESDVLATSTNAVYFTGPTPGAPNSQGVAAPGPAIVSSTHSPNVPKDDEDVLVTCRVLPTFNLVASVALRYRIMFDSEVEVQMFDDGTHGDGAAGDGVYGAVIPASASTNGQMIRWSFRATDSQGYVSRWPLFADPANTPEYLGTIVDPTNVTSVLPIIHLFVDPAQQSAVDGQAGGRASVFHDREFYDNVGMQLRGNSTAGYLKKSHRMDFNREHPFRHSGPGPRIRKTSFEADYPDPTYFRQGMAFWLCDQLGAPAPFYVPVRLQLNSQFYQFAHHNDVHGDELLARLGYDPNGALYNAAGTVQASQFSTGGFEKKTRKQEGNADYTALANAMVETLPVATRRTNVFEMLDLPEVINYLVVARFVQENDDVWANMSLYHDNDGDGLWRIIPFDMNLSWGAFFLDNAANDTGIQATNDNHKSFPLYGSSQALSLTSGNYNRIYDVIFQVPQTREMFLRRMRTMLDKYVGPPGTPPNTSLIEQRIFPWRDLIVTEAANDRAKWGWPAIGGQGNLYPGTNLFFGVSDLLQQFLYPRRDHFYVKHSVTNSALAIGITKTQNAGIPLAQPPSAVIQITSIEANPSSGNQGQEFIQLTNGNPFAVDVSGWKLDGGVQFTFKPGTVMPSNSVIYVSPDIVAFRSRTTGPRGGQGLFVQGNYKGQLSARGESVLLYDTNGRLVHTNSFAGNPSPAQNYLRITEIMYHPAGGTNADDFEFIELKNIGPTTLNLTGVRFTNGIQFNFTGSTVTNLASGERVLLVKNLAAFTSRYGAGLKIAGQYSGNLENRGETLRLEDGVGEKILEFAYDNQWYPVTDGLGFSLVIKNENAPWDTWGDKASWRPSGQLNGTPADIDPGPPSIPAVLINEALTRSDTAPPTDTIELYNPTAQGANIGGWFLTDDFNTPKKFRIPDTTAIPAGGYLTFNESDFNPNPGVPPSFALSSGGDEVYLFSGDANTNLTGYVHGFSFGAAEDGVSFGRYVTSVGEEHFVAQSSRSLGATNTGPKIGPIIITEIMYRPPDTAGADNSLDEFIEFFNLSADNVSFFNPLLPTNTWQIKGGVDFVFPTNVTLAANSYLLVVNFDPANANLSDEFRARYNVPNNVALFGPYAGKLNNSGDNIELKKPTTPLAGKTPYVLVDKVAFQDGPPWPSGADGYGLSLQRRDFSKYANDPANWVAAPPTAAAETVTALTAPVITAQPANATIVAFTNGALSVTASGSEPLSYQWRFNGANIAGATGATLQLANVQPEQAGNYKVVVFNSAGSEVSTEATVNVFFPVTIFAQPQARTITLGSVTNVTATNLVFSVFAASSGPISYQWRFNGANIAGATNSTYALTSVSTTNNGTFDAVVGDSVRTFVTDPAPLTVLVLPVVRQGLPGATTIVQGDNITYTIVVSGFPPPFFYQWRKGTTIYTNIFSSSTTSSFTLFNQQPADGGLNRVVVTNLAGSTAAFNQLTILADADGDHVPDVWETQYGFKPNDPSDGLDDPDHDGSSNLHEYQAGTNPTNALSVFKIEGFVLTNSAAFRFLAVSNKTYSVQFAPALANAPWVNLSNVVARTTNRTIAITQPKVANTNRFYRVVTPQQP